MATWLRISEITQKTLNLKCFFSKMLLKTPNFYRKNAPKDPYICVVRFM